MMHFDFFFFHFHLTLLSSFFLGTISLNCFSTSNSHYKDNTKDFYSSSLANCSQSSIVAPTLASLKSATLSITIIALENKILTIKAHSFVLDHPENTQPKPW
jgi:hypothetical protein